MSVTKKSQEIAEMTVWKNAKISIFEGAFYAVMVALGESMIIPSAIFLGLKATEIGVLATLPVALGGFSQYLMPAVEFRLGRRREIIFFLLLLQSLGLIYLSFIAQLDFVHFLLGAILYWIGGAGVQPLWVSWMIPQAPSKKISLYHARRNALLALLTFVFFVGGGLILLGHREIAVFRLFFLMAGLSRVLGGILILRHQEDPTWDERKREAPQPEIREPMRRNGVGYLIGVLVLFRLGSGIAAPHFAQYMLKDLELTYLVYTILVGSAFLGRTILLESWIVTSYEFGSKTTLLVSCGVISIVPVLWLMSDQFVWLLGLEILSGGAWAGFELLTIMILAGMGLRGWSRYVGLLGMFCTLAALASGWFGGWLLDHGFSMKLVCTLSTGVRLLATGFLFVIFARVLRGDFVPRKVIPLFFSTLSLRPSFSNINSLFWRRRRAAED